MARFYRHVYTTRNKKTGKMEKRKTRNWYFDYMDEHGKLITHVPGYRDKLATQRKAAELEGEVLRRLRGERPARRLESSGLSLAEHLRDYNASQLTRGVSTQHVEITAERLRRLLAGFGTLEDIDRQRIESWLAARRESGELAAATSNHYLKSAKAFLNWAIAEHRLAINPLAGLRRLNVETDRRLRRRALTDAEFAALVDAASRSPIVYRGLSGIDRARLYTFAGRTGLRRSELFSLTPASFHLDAKPPTVTVEASASKHRRRDLLPLSAALAAQVRQWIAGREPTVPLWRSTRWFRCADMLRLDLQAAGIPFADAQGRVVDFHSLRVYFVTSLARAGVPLAVAQRLARHSTPMITTSHYTQLELQELADEIEKLPD